MVIDLIIDLTDMEDLSSKRGTETSGAKEDLWTREGEVTKGEIVGTMIEATRGIMTEAMIGATKEQDQTEAASDRGRNTQGAGQTENGNFQLDFE